METTSVRKKIKNNIPQDIVTEIQLRLPAKSLCRFKCASKSWNDQISSPPFLDMHHKQSKKNSYLLFRKDYVTGECPKADKWVSEWNFMNPGSPSLINSFNTRCQVSGLIVTCQSVVCFLGTKDGEHTQVFLYSVSTKELLALPMRSSSKFSRGPIAGCGIGCIPSTQKYKVALLFLRNNEITRPHFRYKCQVIEISNGRGRGDSRNYSNWRLVEEEVPCLLNSFRAPAFVDEYIYWEAWCRDLIVSFNIKDEKFETLDFPNIDHPLVCNGKYLAELQGKLGMARDSESYPCFTMVIWILKDRRACIWEKRYTILLGGIKLRSGYELMKPIYHFDKEIILYAEGYLVFYSTETNTYRMIDKPVNFSPVGMYHESLFCLGTAKRKYQTPALTC